MFMCKFKLCFFYIILFVFMYNFSECNCNNNLLLSIIFQEEILGANFTPEDPGELIGGSRFKPVDQFALPKVCCP